MSDSNLAGLGDASRFRAIAGGAAEFSTGSEGAGVMELQKKLEQWGFPPGPIDGIFGPLTKEAVQALQRKLGIPATGAWDSVTVQAVEADLARTPSVLLSRVGSGLTPPAGQTQQPQAAGPVSLVKRVVASPLFWAAAAVGGLVLMARSGGAEVTIDGIAFGASEEESAGVEAPDADELEAAVARAEAKRKRAAAKKRKARAAAAAAAREEKKPVKKPAKKALANIPASEMTIDVTPEAVTIEEENADG